MDKVLATCQKSSGENGASETEEEEELLECPVCLETPRKGPIFSCTNGHLIVSMLKRKRLCAFFKIYICYQKSLTKTFLKGLY